MMRISGRTICSEEPPYIIAELSANHNGNIEQAFAIMEASAEAGADAIKLQTYSADTMTIACDRPEFQINDGLWAGYSLYDLYKEAATPWEWHSKLFEKGRELGITVFSTPFDETAVDFLEDMQVPAYKIASFELTHLPLIAYVAKTKKPVIMSTGMANIEEITQAVETAKSGGCDQLMLLHCVSSYPALPGEINLQTMADMRQRYGVEIGLSDHTLGNVASVAAVALGATVIEKHVTMRRSDGGPDSAFSLEPEELATLVEDCHTAWAAIGSVNYSRTKGEKGNVRFRRSVFATRHINAGEAFSSDNIRIIRPGHGLLPKYFPDLLGRFATRDIEYGSPLSWDDVAGGQA